MKLQNSQIRELAILLLYQQSLNSDLSLEDSLHHILSNTELLTQTLNKDEIDENKFDSLKQYLKPIQTNDKIVPKGSFKQFEYDEDIMIPHYLEQIVNGVQENSDEIDQLIDQHIQGNWSVNRLELINLEILRVAVYEMLYADREVVPKVVALSEALELAKLYSDDKSRKFINGVLSNIMDDIN